MKTKKSLSLEELLKKPLTKVSDLEPCFERCLSPKDVYKVIEAVPPALGQFKVSFDDEYEMFFITNTQRTEAGEQVAQFWFSYAANWNYEDI